MLKVIRFTLAGVFAAGAAYAGSAAYVASTEPVSVSSQGMMGEFGPWLIPLVAIAIIALAMKNNTGTG